MNYTKLFTMTMLLLNFPLFGAATPSNNELRPDLRTSFFITPAASPIINPLTTLTPAPEQPMASTPMNSVSQTLETPSTPIENNSIVPPTPPIEDSSIHQNSQSMAIETTPLINTPIIEPAQSMMAPMTTTTPISEMATSTPLTEESTPSPMPQNIDIQEPENFLENSSMEMEEPIHDETGITEEQNEPIIAQVSHEIPEQMKLQKIHSMDTEPTPETIEESDVYEQDKMPKIPKESMIEKQIVVMNSTNQKMNLYGMDAQQQKTLLAQDLGPIAKVLIPANIKTLKAESTNPDDNADLIELPHSAKAIVQHEGLDPQTMIPTDNLSILLIKHHPNIDAVVNQIELEAITKEVQQGVIIYNTTTEPQMVKVSYPDEATFFITPKIHYLLAPCSVEFFTLPSMNKKNKRTKINLGLVKSKKPHVITPEIKLSTFVIHSADHMTFIDNITEDFED